MKIPYRLLLSVAFCLITDNFLLTKLAYSSPSTVKPTETASPAHKAIVSLDNLPHAIKKPVEITLHSDKRIDNYAWMKDSAWPNEIKDKDILQYIKAENSYTEAVLKPLKNLEETLCQEMKSRIVEEDSSYPTQEDDYLYYTRFEKGKDFTIHCRKKIGSDKEEIILDENELAKGQKNFSLGSLRVSPDHTLVAYSYDTSGTEIFLLQVKDIKTGKLLIDKMENTFSNPLQEYPPQIIWHTKLNGFFYTTQNKAQRSDKVFFHILGEPQSKDRLVYEERDERYWAGIRLSADKQFVLIETGDSETAETMCLDLRSESLTPIVVLPRTQGVWHTVNSRKGYFYFSINDKDKAYRLVRMPIDKTTPDHWEEILAPSVSSSLTHFALYEDHLAVRQKERGIPHIARVI